jgi:hypothetical protein
MLVRSSSVFQKALTLAAINAAIAGQDLTPGSINGQSAFVAPVLSGFEGGSGLPTPGANIADPGTFTPGAPCIWFDSGNGKLYWFDGVTNHEIAFV